MASPHDIETILAGTPDPNAPHRARLSLEEATARRPGINGGWWPLSRDAGAELPVLLAVLTARAGRVSRVAVQVDAFDYIPVSSPPPGARFAWHGSGMNMHSVLLTMAGREDLVLLVVPPQANPAAAAKALMLAASGRDVGPPEAILAAAGIGELSATATGSGPSGLVA